MAQYITSLLELKARQDELPDEQKPVLSLDDLIYVVHGEGSDRDTVWTLEEIKKFFGEDWKAQVLTLLGNMDSTASIPKAGGWKLYTDTDVTSPRYGRLLFQFQNPSSTLPSTDPATVHFPAISVLNDSNFDKSVTIKKNLTVQKNLSAKKIEAEIASINALKRNYIIDVDSASFALSTRQAEVGDCIVIHNKHSSNVTVEVHVVRDSTSGWVTARWNVTLKQRSSMELICIAIHNINDVLSYEWSPLCNSEVTVANP